MVKPGALAPCGTEGGVSGQTGGRTALYGAQPHVALTREGHCCRKALRGRALLHRWSHGTFPGTLRPPVSVGILAP
jgi:hypothetical protein